MVVNVCIVGGGLSGSMMAILLSSKLKNYNIHLFEKRPSSSENTEPLKRSINLALSFRGGQALQQIGLYDTVMKFAIPMSGRAIHVDKERSIVQAYGKPDEAIYSVSRVELNLLLLEKAKSMKNVTVHYNSSLEKMEDKVVVIVNSVDGSRAKYAADLVIGADGAYSTVRGIMSRKCRQSYSQYYIEHGYKELTIPPDENGDFNLKPVNALHIWPRGNFMMIALPNPDKSFTCTLFAPYHGTGGLLDLNTKDKVLEHFEKYFPDAIEKMPNLVEEYEKNPNGALATMKVNPWHVEDYMVLIGDAAHAIVPFYGQGMNSGFEDCLILSELFDEYDGQLDKILPTFTKVRKPTADALAQLSFDNYVEMRKHTASKLFRFQKRVEAVLHFLFPRYWIPLYTMVSFTRIPYDQAIRRARRQDKILSYTAAILCTASLTILFKMANKCIRK